jgi:hypothetical protein
MKKMDKLIITNAGALKAKYGKQVTRIRKAADLLIKRDAARGIHSVLVFLDQPNKAVKGYKPVTDIPNPRQCKIAIDILYRHYRPDYLMILGSRDVIPHVPMQNLADKEDAFVNSDLPYACEEPYSTAPGDFLAPVRVVGRLPDITGGSDARYLATLLTQAADYKPAVLSPEEDYFAICVPAWENSAKDGLKNMFHDTDDLRLCPPKSPHTYTSKDLSPRVHFFNCHGNKHRPEFYGQHGNDFPMALSSHIISGKITPGTVVAAECCYGADLYDPAPSKELPLCNTYLINGAICFAGSTTVAYGAASGQGQADLLTQYFVQYLFKGASAGRAFLQARLDFMQQRLAQKDTADLKTIAQFILLGDPSIQIVESTEHRALRTVLNKATLHIAASHQRKNRRTVMVSHAGAIKKNSLLPKRVITKRKTSLERHIRQIASKHRLDKYEITTFSYDNQKSPKKGGIYCHHLLQHRSARVGGVNRRTTELLIIQEAEGQIMDVRHYHSR